LCIADEIVRRSPNAAGRAGRNNGVIERHVGQSGLTDHIVAVQACMISAKRFGVVERNEGFMGFPNGRPTKDVAF